MAISKNAGGGSGKYIKEAGEYKVKVVECKTGLSKKGKPMLTILFRSNDEREIAGYFVRDLSFHIAALQALKLAAGIKATEHQDALVGKDVGILVEMGEPGEQGTAFASIVGYGPASEVTGVRGPSLGTGDANLDEVPF